MELLKWHDFSINESSIKNINYIVNNYKDYFSISFEIELENTEFHSKPYNWSENKNNFKNNFPNFYLKWSSYIKIVIDDTLKYGLEINFKKYLTNFDTAVEFIEDFYKDLYNQSVFVFSNRTGIHINIGKLGSSKYNIIKGALLLSDDKEYFYRGIESRIHNQYCMPIFNFLKKNIDSSIEYLPKNIRSVKDLESFLNKSLIEIINNSHNDKEIGFNFGKLNKNYIEFRFTGGYIKKDDLIQKLKNYMYIVYIMTNEDYKKEIYHKKISKFYFNLLGIGKKEQLFKEFVNNYDIIKYNDGLPNLPTSSFIDKSILFIYDDIFEICSKNNISVKFLGIRETWNDNTREYEGYYTTIGHINNREMIIDVDFKYMGKIHEIIITNDNGFFNEFFNKFEEIVKNFYDSEKYVFKINKDVSVDTISIKIKGNKLLLFKNLNKNLRFRN